MLADELASSSIYDAAVTGIAVPAALPAISSGSPHFLHASMPPAGTASSESKKE
jgi:hypothetical protein